MASIAASETTGYNSTEHNNKDGNRTGGPGIFITSLDFLNQKLFTQFY